MAGRSPYSHEQKSEVYVGLKANDNNVKRTARETGVPENTVRRWRDEWANGINVPDAKVLTAKASEFIEDAERVRGMAIVTLENKIPDAKPSELITIIGVLDDKITRAKGIDRDRNLHVHHHLPSAAEIQELMGGFVQASIRAADQRQDDVIDAELVEVRALPSAT